jgi:thiosulfate/3-mercaptopyruvate sulfurtransferase
MTSSGTIVHDEPRTLRHQVLVEPDWLRAHLRDPGLRVVEVDVSPLAYDSWHIEGAVLWNIYRDLKDADYAFVGADAFRDLIESSGIAADSTVVLYGYAPAMGLWLLTLFGHRDVRILDCSRAEWECIDGPRTPEPAVVARTRYELAPERAEQRADLAGVERAMSTGSALLVDVRSPEEFRGERFWPSGGSEPGGRAGHVPTAWHVPVDGLLDERGRFRSTGALLEIFADLEPAGGAAVITYCTIGARAAAAWFALTYLLGREQVSVYDGSWAQWGRTPSVPVEA